MKKGNKKEHKELEKIQEKPKFFTSLVEILKKKWLVNRTMTLILIAIVVAIYIGINILLDKVILPEVDCTENKMYSISQETKDKIGDIDKEINIQIINFSSYQSVIDFIEKYIEVNNNIKIEKIDNLSARTDLMQKYSLDETGNLIIIKSGDNETTLGEYDLYTYDYTTYEEIDITEEAITNAILDVTTENKPKVYFLNSHLAYNISYYSTIMSEIENEANEVDTLDILTTGKIPDDCDCLVITTLSEDLTELERDKILEYISNGGKILLLCGPNIQDIDLSNFQKILDEYGVTIENGVVFEGSNSNMLAGYPDCIVEDVSTSASFMEKLNMAMSLCLTDAGKIVLDEDKAEELDVEYETIATTTEDAFIRTDLTQQSVTRTSQDSETGEITVAAMATKTLENDKTSKLIVYSNEMFVMDMPIKINGYTMYTVNLYNNEDAILNSISYLNNREDTITIRKQNESVNYTVTDQQNRIIMIIIFTLPFLIIVAGIIIWQVRKRKR